MNESCVLKVVNKVLIRWIHFYGVWLLMGLLLRFMGFDKKVSRLNFCRLNEDLQCERCAINLVQIWDAVQM